MKKQSVGKEKQINVRLDEKSFLMLQDKQKMTGLKVSEIIRKLIQEGAVNYMPEGKALIEQVTTFRDEVNQATLQIDEQINFVKKEILELKNDPQKCGYSIEQKLYRKEMELESLRKIWQQEKEKASKGVDGCVSI